MHRKPGNRSRQHLRRVVRERDGDDCALCGKPMEFDMEGPEFATLEHIVPRSRGGCNSPINLVLAHKRCNAARGDRFIGAERHVPAPQWFCQTCDLGFRDWLLFRRHMADAHCACPHCEEGCVPNALAEHEWLAHGILKVQWIEK